VVEPLKARAELARIGSLGDPWLVTGARGQLGADLCAALSLSGEQVHALSHADLDIADAAAVASLSGTSPRRCRECGWLHRG
jgi:NAD(P)-dependent dehydrogenase (short-subunit alcohol dehydrogenase family)